MPLFSFIKPFSQISLQLFGILLDFSEHSSRFAHLLLISLANVVYPFFRARSLILIAFLPCSTIRVLQRRPSCHHHPLFTFFHPHSSSFASHLNGTLRRRILPKRSPFRKNYSYHGNLANILHKEPPFYVP